jgi:hypothetical protein
MSASGGVLAHPIEKPIIARMLAFKIMVTRNLLSMSHPPFLTYHPSSRNYERPLKARFLKKNPWKFMRSSNLEGLITEKKPRGNIFELGGRNKTNDEEKA